MPGAGPLAAGPHVPAGTRMTTTADNDRISRATRMLAAGRVPGLVVAFAIPLVLARVFDQTEFGTYKQLFLIYATLFGLAQLGMAESLYYFVPREPSQAGRHVANALVALVAIGLACVRGAVRGRAAHRRLADQPGARPHLVPLGWIPGADADVRGARDRVDLARETRHGRVGLCGIGHRPGGMLRGAGRHRRGACAACWPAPCALRGGAAGRHADRAVARIRIRAARRRCRCCARQLAYALPFALAVGIEVLHLNWHQYAVAARFDAATFAIYAVGCLQIPMVDLIVTSTVNVMMVEMSAARERDLGGRAAALARHHWPAVLHDLPARRVARADGPRDHRRAVHHHL